MQDKKPIDVKFDLDLLRTYALKEINSILNKFAIDVADYVLNKEISIRKNKYE